MNLQEFQNLIERSLTEPIEPQVIYTTPEIARVIEVFGLFQKARLRGLRDGWKKSRIYSRLLKSLCRP